MKLIFLDRDGVINKDPGLGDYVKSWEEFHFLPGAIEAIKRLNQAGYEIIIISNQGGIAKGLFSEEALKDITERMLEEIKRQGGRIRSIHYCIHKDEDGCDCRKPKTGLFKQAAEGLNIGFDKSYYIGDGRVDVEAGASVGCKTVLLQTGKTDIKDIKDWKIKPDYIKRDLKETVDWILDINCRGHLSVPYNYNLRSLWAFWKKVARIIGNFQARLILLLFYWTILLPFGILIRLFADPISLKSLKDTNWKSWMKKPLNLEEAKRQW